MWKLSQNNNPSTRLPLTPATSNTAAEQEAVSSQADQAGARLLAAQELAAAATQAAAAIANAARTVENASALRENKQAAVRDSEPWETDVEHRYTIQVSLESCARSYTPISNDEQ